MFYYFLASIQDLRVFNSSNNLWTHISTKKSYIFSIQQSQKFRHVRRRKRTHLNSTLPSPPSPKEEIFLGPRVKGLNLRFRV